MNINNSMNIFVSTGAFKSRNLVEILDIASKNDINRIELAPGLDYDKNIIDVISDANKDFEFLIHNYFPTPKEQFALNLASLDERVNSMSLEMCKTAIDICYKLNIPHYSVHSGFCFDTEGEDLGKSSQVSLGRISVKKAHEQFVKNLRTICEYGEERNVNILIENNVVAGFAKGDKELLLGVDSADIINTINSVGRENLGFLIDLAHAKVSSNSYGFDMENYIEITKKYVTEVHASENDGISDQNGIITQNSDVYGWLKYYKDKIITLEVYNLSVEQIKNQIELISEAIS